jgi:hypothetical protein
MTFTDDLRQRVRDRLGDAVCPTCGQETNPLGVRTKAQLIGVDHSTLWRFLRGGKPSSALIDALVSWLEQAKGAER